MKPVLYTVFYHKESCSSNPTLLFLILLNNGCYCNILKQRKHLAIPKNATTLANKQRQIYVTLKTYSLGSHVHIVNVRKSHKRKVVP